MRRFVFTITSGQHDWRRVTKFELSGRRAVMLKLRKFGTALALATFIGSGMIAFSPTVHAAGLTTARYSFLCRYLAAAIGYVQGLSDSEYKTKLLNYLLEEYEEY